MTQGDNLFLVYINILEGKVAFCLHAELVDVVREVIQFY